MKRTTTLKTPTFTEHVAGKLQSIAEEMPAPWVNQDAAAKIFAITKHQCSPVIWALVELELYHRPNYGKGWQLFPPHTITSFDYASARKPRTITQYYPTTPADGKILHTLGKSETPKNQAKPEKRTMEKTYRTETTLTAPPFRISEAIERAAARLEGDIDKLHKQAREAGDSVFLEEWAVATRLVSTFTLQTKDKPEPPLPSDPLALAILRARSHQWHGAGFQRGTVGVPTTNKAGTDASNNEIAAIINKSGNKVSPHEVARILRALNLKPLASQPKSEADQK